MKENRTPKRVSKAVRALKIALETLKVTSLVIKVFHALWKVLEFLSQVA